MDTVVAVVIEYMKQKKYNIRRVKRFQLELAKSSHLRNKLTYLFLSSTNVVGLLNNNQRIWMKPRSNENWMIILNHYSDTDWLENFRMSKNSFIILCAILRPSLEPKETFLKSREPLSVEKQVAVCVFKLCSCSEYRVVGSVFGIHKSTVKKCVYNVTNAILNNMMRQYVFMPNEVEAEEISSHFESITKVPMLLGAIDGTHIPITAPKDGYRDFVNRKGWPSFNMQAVVDHTCRFRNVFIKYPGSVHDATVLKGSMLYKHHNEILPQDGKFFNGINIGYMIVGDPAYPLLDWILKGYSGACTPQEESFNVYLNSGRVVVEWAFGRLKARFRILQKRMDIFYKFVPKIVVACCILHNFIEDRKESFIQQWINDVEAAEVLLPQPKQPVALHAYESAAEVRRFFCNYLADNFALKKSYLR